MAGPSPGGRPTMRFPEKIQFDTVKILGGNYENFVLSCRIFPRKLALR